MLMRALENGARFRRATVRRLTMIGTELITVSSVLSRRSAPPLRKLPGGLRAEVYFIMTRINHN